MICPDCGADLHLGDFPFCHGDPIRHSPSAATAIGDECDLVQENGFSHPTRFTSKTALKKALDAKGLEMRVRHMPIPGTDKSPHTTDWSRGSVDLEAAKVLVTRTGGSGKTETAEPIMGTWTIRDWTP